MHLKCHNFSVHFLYLIGLIVQTQLIFTSVVDKSFAHFTLLLCPINHKFCTNELHSVKCTIICTYVHTSVYVTINHTMGQFICVTYSDDSSALKFFINIRKVYEYIVVQQCIQHILNFYLFKLLLFLVAVCVLYAIYVCCIICKCLQAMI